MNPDFATPDDALLAGVDRGGVIESWHRGIAVVLDPAGETILSLGDPDAPLLPRSTLKLVIADALLEAGLELSDEEVALASASIDATPEHLRIATSMRDRFGLRDEDLSAPAVTPPAGGEKTPLAHQCVGKHLAFAAAARQLLPADVPYASTEHPLHQLVVRHLAERAHEAPGVSVIDGCGAPIMPISTRGLARALQSVARGRVGRAMLDHGWLVQAPNTADTVLCDAGLVAKRGAEGVQFVMAADGTTVVVNTSDGSERVGPTVALALLRRSGAIDANTERELIARIAPRILGGKAVVGALRVSSDVTG